MVPTLVENSKFFCVLVYAYIEYVLWSIHTLYTVHTYIQISTRRQVTLYSDGQDHK